MVKEDIIMSWSGGKDSAYALYSILKEGKYNVKYLLTNIYQPNGRVSMHGVPEQLINRQAKQIGIPLVKLYIAGKSDKEYAKKMKRILIQFKQEGIHHVAFGDIFLEDLKQYREEKLKEVDMKGVFPLWQKDTSKLSQQFIKEGFKTHICAIDLSKIPEELVGVDYSVHFLSKITNETDPCGENGEFHSFCYDGPIFNKRVNFQINGTSEQFYEHNGHSYKYLFSDITM